MTDAKSRALAQATESPQPTPADWPRAKHLPPRVPAGEEPLLVPARILNEVTYCERLAYLEWVQSEFAHNEFTLDGVHTHARTDVARGELRSAEEVNAGTGDDKPNVVRSLWVSSTTLGISAKADLVEERAGGGLVPVEYKRGAVPEHGPFLPERVQVAAQVMVLREQGYDVPHGILYFARSKKRVAVEVDEALEAEVVRAVAKARALPLLEAPPPPLDNSPKCNGCSLIGICLPDETNYLRKKELAEAQEPELDDEEDVGPAPVEMRRLHPARDERIPVYVQEHGAYVGLDGDELVIKRRDGSKVRARIPNTSQLSLFGNVQISTQALRRMFEDEIPVAFHSAGGYFVGRTQTHESKNVELRLMQYRATIDPRTSLDLARSFVDGKLRNCRTLLRRNQAEPEPVVLFELKQLLRKAKGCEQMDSLLGLEGSAARAYFRGFARLLKSDGMGTFDFEQRNRRPPRDPVNAMLSFGYAVLAKDVTIAAAGVGLDPLLGFYHQPHFGRSSLALDLMEEFRPLIVDSIVLSLVNTKALSQGDFLVHPTGCALSEHGRRTYLLAYERRMDQLVTHPLFGYPVSYRRVLEIQARLLTRYLLGEIGQYPSFVTR